MEIIELLESYSGALTVIVTVVYVIATIFICVANIKSAKASRDQIAESQRQFEETKRLECMPFLQMEISYDNVTPEFDLQLPLCSKDIKYPIRKTVKLKNVGNGTATTITYSWNYKGNNISKIDYPPINAIMKGDAYYILICCDANETLPFETSATLTFQYNDLLGYTYEQKIILHFDPNKLLWCENDIPEYLGIVKYSLANKEK